MKVKKKSSGTCLECIFLSSLIFNKYFGKSELPFYYFFSKILKVKDFKEWLVTPMSYRSYNSGHILPDTAIL